MLRFWLSRTSVSPSASLAVRHLMVRITSYVGVLVGSPGSWDCCSSDPAPSSHPDGPATTPVIPVPARTPMTLRTVISQRIWHLRCVEAASPPCVATLLDVAHTALVLPSVRLTRVCIDASCDGCNRRLLTLACSRRACGIICWRNNCWCRRRDSGSIAISLQDLLCCDVRA